MTSTNGNTNFPPLTIGEDITIPAWSYTGRVLTVEPDRSGFGSDASLSVTMDDHRCYRLEPHEWTRA